MSMSFSLPSIKVHFPREGENSSTTCVSPANVFQPCNLTTKTNNKKSERHRKRERGERERERERETEKSVSSSKVFFHVERGVES